MNATTRNRIQKLSRTVFVSAILVSLVGIRQASATVLLPIAGVTATSTSGNAEGNPGFTTSNNSLVAGASTVLGASDSLGDSGFNPGTASDFGNFVTFTPGANVTYDLGAAYNVSNLLIWNFSQEGYTSAGANSVTILEGTSLLSLATVGTYTFNEVTVDPGYGSPRYIAGAPDQAGAVPPYSPFSPAGTANVPAQILPVSIVDAQYIELQINSNWGFGGGLVGINEVNFVGIALPEPSTWAMMLVALSLLVFGA